MKEDDDMTKKEIKNSPKMSMEHFLRTYYDMSEEMTQRLSTLSHRKLKEVAFVYNIPLPRKNMDYLEKEDILTGSVILVEDCYGNPAPYENPLIYLMDEIIVTDDEPQIEGDDFSGKHKGRQKVKHIKS